MWHRFLLVLMHYIPWLKRRNVERCVSAVRCLRYCGLAFYELRLLPGRQRLSAAPNSIAATNPTGTRSSSITRLPLKAGPFEREKGLGGRKRSRRRGFLRGPVSLTCEQDRASTTSDRAVELSNRLHHVEGLTFFARRRGGAPLESDSLDVVINVESSHCYGSMEKFLQAVRRVFLTRRALSFHRRACSIAIAWSFIPKCLPVASP